MRAAIVIFFPLLSGFLFFLNTGQSRLKDTTIRMEQLKVPHILNSAKLSFLLSTWVRLCCHRVKTYQGPRNPCPEAEIPDIPWKSLGSRTANVTALRDYLTMSKSSSAESDLSFKVNQQSRMNTTTFYRCFYTITWCF